MVVDAAEGALAVAEAPLTPRYRARGAVEQDPEALLESVLQAGREALARAGRPVAAVALANQGETVLAWDRTTGRPLSTAIVWQDRRAADVCSELAPHGEMIAARTGLMLDPYFAAPKMAWLRRHVTTDGVVTMTDTWLIHHLTGAFVTDASTVSRSLLIDVNRAAWDPELVELFGLADEPLPTVLSCDASVGTTTAFGAPIELAGLVLDQPAALLAQTCWDPGEAKCTFGTGAFLLANTGPDAVRSSAGLTTSIAWRLRDATTYCVDGQIFTAASAVRWLVDLGLIGEPAELDAVEDDDPDAVLCVPALAGLAAPWWRSDATASFSGMTLATGRGQLALAVLRGIAAQLAELTDVIALDATQPLRSLRVDGGLTRSRVLMQAVADLTQLPVSLYPSPHATALGAAACARLATDTSLGLADAVSAWTPEAMYEPRWTADRAAAYRERWRELAASTLPPDQAR